MQKEKAAKPFMSGGSQAVRLPKEFRFEGTEVRVRREGDAVILEPLEKPGWPEGYGESFGPVSDDFVWPEPLPESPHREAALEELIRWLDERRCTCSTRTPASSRCDTIRT